MVTADDRGDRFAGRGRRAESASRSPHRSSVIDPSTQGTGMPVPIVVEEAAS
jgi:hypothetical protein